MTPAASDPDEVVVTPLGRARRKREVQMVGLFLVAALPVALVLWLALNPASAAIYVVAQTAFLWFGFRRRHEPTLRLRPDGLSFEPGHFQLRATWDDVDRVEEVTLPSGRTEALVLVEGRLHWAADPTTRKTVLAKGWDRIIPVAEFDPAWRDGAIGEAVRRWAPDLRGL